MGEHIIRQSHHQLQDDISLDELRELLELQTAIYAYVTQFYTLATSDFRSLHDDRHNTASELVRLLEASYLFTRCAIKGPGKMIAFDLGMTPLIEKYVAD